MGGMVAKEGAAGEGVRGGCLGVIHPSDGSRVRVMDHY